MLPYEIKLLQKLVRTPSVNPPGNENKIAELIKKELKEFKPQSFKVQGRPNLVFKTGRAGKKRLVFQAHMDTVPITCSWSKKPFGAEIIKDRLYGRGSCDTKGTMAAMISAFKELSKKKLKGELLLVLNSDEEEGGSKGIGGMINKLGRIDACIIAEPTMLKVINCEKGVTWFKLIFNGKSAHASQKHLGINAIEKASKAVMILSKINFKKNHKSLGSPSINVGSIRGGDKINMVPDYCEVIIDVRTVPGQGAEQIEKVIKKKLKKYLHSITKPISANPGETREDHPFVKLALSCVNKKVLGSFPAASDMRFFTEKGIPTIIYGAGSIKQAHVTDEFINIKDVSKAKKFFEEIALKFLS